MLPPTTTLHLGCAALTLVLFGSAPVRAQNLDSIVLLLDSPDWRERSNAVFNLGRVPVTELPGSFAAKAIALLETEALNPDEDAISEGEGYGEYLVSLSDAVLRLEDVSALRGLALLGIETSLDAKEFVASHGGQSLPYLDEAWQLERPNRSHVALTWGMMAGEFSGHLSDGDLLEVLERLLGVATTDSHAFIMAARRSGLGELVGVLDEIALTDSIEHRRALAQLRASSLRAARDALSPSELHSRLTTWLDAICLRATGARVQTCTTLSGYLQNGPSDGTLLDAVVLEAEAAEAAGTINHFERSLLAENAGFLIVSQGLSVVRTVDAAADTYIRLGDKNVNGGTEPILRVQRAGDNRALLQFDKANIAAAVASGTLVSAKLALTIVDNGNNWGPEGRTVDVNRLTLAWTESGATWNCASDTDTNNNQADCPDGAWEMSDAGPNPWEPTASATMFFTNDLTGVVQFDVTADVQAFLDDAAVDFGWIVMGTDTQGSGTVDFSSRENASPPLLLLEVQF